MRSNVGVAIALCVGLIASSCAPPPKAFGPVTDAEQAKAAALFHTDLQPPITIVGEVRHGLAGELYKGPQGMCADGDECVKAREARRQRVAWKVYLTGLKPGNDCAVAICPLVRTNQGFIIDELDGTVLWVGESEGEIGF